MHKEPVSVQKVNLYCLLKKKKKMNNNNNNQNLRNLVSREEKKQKIKIRKDGENDGNLCTH